MRRDDNDNASDHVSPEPEAIKPGEAAVVLNVPLRMIKDFIADGSLRLHDDGVIRADVLHLAEQRSITARAALDQLEEWGVGRDFE
ncbi:hypothetical protein QCN27_18555 [Cereibacter sp. SYSU M97828]|nr:hypothetical protein [Cereibacter flavus]